MRMFPNTVAGVIEALETSFGMDIYADKVVERLLRRNKKWGSRDRSFVAEHTYEIVRNWRLLWWLLDEEPSTKRKTLWKLVGVYFMWRGIELPDWPKFDSIRDFNIADRLASLPSDVGIIESFPEWFDEMSTAQLGDQWPAIAHELNSPASVILRVNTAKSNRKEVLSILEQSNISAKALDNSEIAIALEGRPRLNHIEAFQNGLFEVQDAGSQEIGPYVEVEPGMNVIDACAGAGGKTLHMANLMNNHGSIVSMDIEDRKLGELLKRAERAGIDIVETDPISDRRIIDKYENWADRLLLDVPCSGTGVIKRDPDTKWKLKPEHLERTIEIQRDIVDRYEKMLKPGGKLIYATCSILKSENEDQVREFLSHHPEYELEDEQRVNPSEFSDGFYMARMIKKG
ncbi:RsmB/NOP family class I SAM-dependent RNA methyltransferase [Phaeocystidibacter luteus]|uniref:RNA methyltransferase n=1 Tax=Phaeocystidibacter luteus TaxID=911197 RepID=A0A6N6RKB2_9FLAO|nr:RNA methyltransferase [Phaeocystidibacter luteus]KAB2814358.1 RNA methyltransferase [Phaeocystidibacter luteus]